VERDRTHRSEKGTEFEKRPVFKGPGQIGGPVRGSEPAPGDKVGVRRDGSCRVYLQQSQSVDEVHQIGRPGPVKQLSSYRELSRLVTVEL
jgi:hypothetical protein